MIRTLAALMLLICSFPVTMAEDEYAICRIEAQLKSGQKHELTGFRVKGMAGIYTALHGVLGCEKIDAIFHDPKARRVSMSLVQVDIDRDVAFLVAADSSAKLPQQGLSLGIWPASDQLESVLAGQPATVVGHALGIDLKPSHSRLTLRTKRPVAGLTELLNPSARQELAERGSPSTRVAMLSLEGPFLPGHSGAPILNEENAVIGIGNGGLKEGQVSHGWAIPFHDVKLVSVDDNDVAKRIALIPPLRSNRSLFLIVDASVRKQQELLSRIATFVETEDGRPVRAFKVPSETTGPDAVPESNAGQQRSDVSALERFLTGRVFLYSGTRVVIKSEPTLLTDVLSEETMPTGLDGLFVRVEVVQEAGDEQFSDELFVPLASIRRRGDDPSNSIVNSGIMVTGDVSGMIAGRDIIIINPQRAPVKKLVLNNDGMATLVMKEDTEDLLFGGADAQNHVGFAIVGTEVRMLEGRKAPIPVLVYRMVEILSGELKGKKGWVSQNAIRTVETN